MLYDLGACYFLSLLLLLHLLHLLHCETSLAMLAAAAIIALVRALPGVSLDGTKFIFISNKLQQCFAFRFLFRRMPHQRLTKRLLLQSA